jgi:hypothetical protein
MSLSVAVEFDFRLLYKWKVQVTNSCVTNLILWYFLLQSFHIDLVRGTR